MKSTKLLVLNPRTFAEFLQSEVPRKPLPGTSVNKGEREDRGVLPQALSA
jgi:hypothetical protein